MKIKATALAVVVVAVAAVAALFAQQPGNAVLVLGEHLREPFGVAFSREGAFTRAGETFIVEHSGHRISRLSPQGTVRVIAGTGEQGFTGDDGPAIEARFNGPHHLLTGPDGHLYIADTWNNCVRRIDLKTGIISRVAGTGEKGFSGDGGKAVDAKFGGIYALAFGGNTLYICDLDNRRVRAMDLSVGIVRTVAGNGEKGVPVDGQDALTQPLVDPRAVAVDSYGRLYIVERNGHALRVVERNGKIRTVAGNGTPGFSGDGGPAREALLRGPKHISIDDGDNVLISDTENHVIRRYSSRTGLITRFAGTGEAGSSGVGGPAEQCMLNRPHGAQIHWATGAIYISDSDNHRVLRVAQR
jgi:DNA-binding beta-propeller fold protein YncE